MCIRSPTVTKDSINRSPRGTVPGNRVPESLGPERVDGSPGAGNTGGNR